MAKAAKVSDVKLVFVVREIPLYLACSPLTSPATVKALSAAVDALRTEGMPARLAAAYEKKICPVAGAAGLGPAAKVPRTKE